MVTIYACVDVNAVDVLDASGASMVSEGRPDHTPYEVAFDLAPEPARPLIVSSVNVWTGDDFCVR